MNARPTRMAVEAALYKALANGRGAAVEEVEASLGAGEGIDSLEGVELIVAAEELFGVSIEDTEVSVACTSITRLVDLVASKLS